MLTYSFIVYCEIMVCPAVADVGKEFPLGGKKSIEQRNKAGDNSSQEESEFSPEKNGVCVTNGHNAEAKTANQRSYSDDSNRSRFLQLIPVYLNKVYVIFFSLFIFWDLNIHVWYQYFFIASQLLCIFD